MAIDTRDRRASVIGVNSSAPRLEQNPTGHIQRAGRHIGVDVFTSSLPVRARLRLKLVTSLFSIGFLALFWWHAVVMVYKNYVRNVTVPSSLLTPIWIPQLFIPLGMTLLLLQMVVQISGTVNEIRSTRAQD